MKSTGMGYTPQALSEGSSPMGDGHASRVEDTPSSGAPIPKVKRNKTGAAVIPLKGRAVQGIDRYGNPQTIHYHHTPPSKTERYTMETSSSEDSTDGAESNARGRTRYAAASASLVNPMGYDVAEEADPPLTLPRDTTIATNRIHFQMEPRCPIIRCRVHA